MSNEIKTPNATKYENGIQYLECPKCRTEKPLSDFGLRKTSTVRSQSWCKKCRSKQK